MPVESAVDTPVDPIAFAAGPVKLKYGGNARNNCVSPKLEQLVDAEDKTVASMTGQITTDFEDGLYIVNSAQCQAAAGFLNTRSRIDLADVTIECQNDYALEDIPYFE